MAISTLSSVMQQGKVQLRSGSWNWRIRPQTSGAALVFQHRERPQDEMRTWIDETQLSNERAMELGLDPVERLWLDPDGLLWTIRVELPSDWARSHSGQENAVRLSFACGSLQKSVWVPGASHLGQLTHFELSRLLNDG